MNKLCMEMTHVRKKQGAKKMRKKILRCMKRLTSIAENHANNYCRELEARWQETDLSEVETQVILDRMQNILKQLPQAVHQAHERLIGERRVANKDKILSLYEPDVHVLAICPRSVPALIEKLEDEEFCRLQKRRGGTEARISIFKNAYLGRPLRSKGFKHRTVRIGWCVLAHNLWKLGQMANQQQEVLVRELAQAA